MCGKVLEKNSGENRTIRKTGPEETQKPRPVTNRSVTKTGTAPQDQMDNAEYRGPSRTTKRFPVDRRYGRGRFERKQQTTRGKKKRERPHTKTYQTIKCDRMKERT